MIFDIVFAIVETFCELFCFFFVYACGYLVFDSGESFSSGLILIVVGFSLHLAVSSLCNYFVKKRCLKNDT